MFTYFEQHYFSFTGLALNKPDCSSAPQSSSLKGPSKQDESSNGDLKVPVRAVGETPRPSTAVLHTQKQRRSDRINKKQALLFLVHSQNRMIQTMSPVSFTKVNVVAVPLNGQNKNATEAQRESQSTVGGQCISEEKERERDRQLDNTLYGSC